MDRGTSVTLKIQKKPSCSRWAWSSVWGDGNNEWKCCQTPTFSLIWKAAKWTLYWSKEQRNCWDFPFSSEWKRETSREKIAAAKKATGEERCEIKGHSRYVAKHKIKKGSYQEN